MKYFITQEQYEQLREMGETTRVLLDIEAFDKLIDQIGNQLISNLI